VNAAKSTKPRTKRSSGPKSVAQVLKSLHACAVAVEWSKPYGHRRVKAWNECARGDHLLWLIGRMDGGEPGSDQRKRLVLCACECARLSLPHVRKGEERPLKAIETAERWARGEAGVTLDDVRKAAAAAAAYGGGAAYAAAAYAYAAAAAAYAYDAAYAAYAADAAADAARTSVLAKCADIVRKHYPKPPRGAK
jgi:hypothetical protein